MFTSPTYGKVSIERMIELLREFYDRNKEYDCPFNVTVGTDSQNFDTTKIVTCVVMQCEHHGGIYFYKIEKVERIQNVSAKLNYETHLSLEYANQLLDKMMEMDEDLFNSISFAIHIDAGYNPKGKTKELIPSLVGWVHSCGYECKVKPDSFTASCIANRISK
ncbi:MAG: ribonuclease H-like YkuK family protein [Agathobacter sp.]|nr:ribonuclease H-like YkuK family protein [Agathobacter sp.]